MEQSEQFIGQSEHSHLLFSKRWVILHTTRAIVKTSVLHLCVLYFMAVAECSCVMYIVCVFRTSSFLPRPYLRFARL